MRNRIADIIADVADLEADVINIPNLISGGYLDSFCILMLIQTLETEFGATFDFGDDLIESLDSVASIENVLKRRLEVNVTDT